VKNWKTTFAGIVALLTVISKVIMGGVGSVDVGDLGVITAGIGLLTAKDHDVTGGIRRQ